MKMDVRLKISDLCNLNIKRRIKHVNECPQRAAIGDKFNKYTTHWGKPDSNL